MDELLFYVSLAVIVLALLVVFKYKQNKTNTVERPVRDHAAQGAVVHPPNRIVANRNARVRMRAAPAQREVDDEDENIEEAEDAAVDIVLPDGKIGKKKLAKLQAKAEKKSQREEEDREREEQKKRDEKLADIKRREEMKEEKELERIEEEVRRAKEEEQRREEEEYKKLKTQFEIQEEGFLEEADEDEGKNLLQEFVQYIKNEKVVLLEELAAKFRLKTQAAIDRVTDLQKEGTLTGVIDDRGKFIFIGQSELESVSRFVKQRGRVSIAELAESSNTLINLTPETTVVR